MPPAPRVWTPAKTGKNRYKNRGNAGEETGKTIYINFWENGNYQKLYTFSTQFSTRLNPLQYNGYKRIYIKWKRLKWTFVPHKKQKTVDIST